MKRSGKVCYTEGQNIVVEWRFVDGKSERYQDFAAEIGRLKVDAIVTASGDDPIIAAMSVTKAMPIIILTGSDPVARGFVGSPTHPGGNVTIPPNVLARADKVIR